MKAAATLVQAMLNFREDEIQGMLVNKIVIGKLELFPVPDLYSEVKFGQFIQMDMLFEQCENYLALPLSQRSPDILFQRVCRSIAAVYRISASEKLDSEKINERAEMLSECNSESVGILYANYRAMRKLLQKKYANVFPKQEEKKDQTQNTVKGNGGATLSDWLGIRDRMATTLRQGFEEVNNMLLHDVLRYMNRELKPR